MLLLGFFYCIVIIKCVPVAKDDNSYILARVLFYKDADGNIMLASGPVPNTTDVAIRDDITSRISDANIKVASLFNESHDIPESLDVLKLVKGEYATVFVIDAKPKRLTRNFFNDFWYKLWHGPQQQYASKSKAKKPFLLKTARVKLLPGDDDMKPFTGQPSGETINVDVTGLPSPLMDTLNETTYIVNVSTTKPHPTEKQIVNKHFVPNDIYYGIEKKCVNWADNCNLNSNTFLNMSSKYLKYVYKTPRLGNIYP